MSYEEDRLAFLRRSYVADRIDVCVFEREVARALRGERRTFWRNSSEQPCIPWPEYEAATEMPEAAA